MKKREIEEGDEGDRLEGERDDAETPDRPDNVVVSPTCHATEEGRLGDSVTCERMQERKRGVLNRERARALQNLRERARESEQE